MKYGIEVYGSCAANQINRLQVIQSGLLKILLKRDLRGRTNAIHRELNILKVSDIYKMQIYVFVNNCSTPLVPERFNTYFNIRHSTYNLRNIGLEPNFARRNVGFSTVKNIGSRMWNGMDEGLKQKAHQKNFRKHVARFLIDSYREDT